VKRGNLLAMGVSNRRKNTMSTLRVMTSVVACLSSPLLH